MSAAEALEQARGSLLKARRLYMRSRRWKAEDWYRAWASIGPEWERAVQAHASGKEGS